jgi:hypothetical protein
MNEYTWPTVAQYHVDEPALDFLGGILSQGKNFLRTTDNTVNQVLNLTFADESDSYGYGGSGAFNNTTRTAQYDTDITLLLLIYLQLTAGH